MATIKQLSEADIVENGDQFPFFSEAQGDTRKVTFATLKDSVATDFVSAADLAAQTGATLVGCNGGTTVQQELDAKVSATLDTDGTLAANSDARVASQKATKAYADAKSTALAASSGSSLVGFIQSGTGAVGRTVQDKLRESVSAADYGAVLSGLGDSTAAIQAAIDALPATGGVVVVPFMCQAKDIRLNGTARNKQNVVLRGTGWGSGLKVPNGGMTNLSRVNLIDAEGAVNCRIENMTLDGNRTNQTIPVLVDGPDYEDFNLVYMEAAADTVVSGCNIINAPVIGVCFAAPHVAKTGSDRCRIEGCTFRNSKVPAAGMRARRANITGNTVFGVYADEDYGIVVDEYSTGCLVSDNDISDMGDVGVFLFRATDCQVLSNRVTNCLVSIALNDASNDNMVAHNECDGALNSHIQVKNGCLRNSIKHNVLDTAAQYCIVLEAGTGGSGFTEISGNRCRLASFSNIALFDAAFCVVEDNYCWEAVGSGIYLSGACDWTEVNDNYCYNNSTGSAADAGIRLVAQNNVTVEDNKCFDSQGTKTQNWGIRCNESFVGSVALIGNDVRQNKTAGMAISGGTPIVKNNLGWVTEAFGQITLGSASTAVTVTHGMDMTPDLKSVRVTLYDTTVRSTKALYVANVGPTTFEIRADAAPGANTLITWEARYAA